MNQLKPAGEPVVEPQAAVDVIRSRLNPAMVTRGRVLIIGLGGIGLFLARAVTTFLVGLCQSLSSEDTLEVVLVDGDEFSLDNTYRMDVPDFGNKAATLGQEILERIDCPGLSIRWVTDYVTAENVEQLIGEGDCVLLACDNHATRNLVGRSCSGGRLNNVVLISGGNDGVEEGLRGTYGNVQVYVREAGRDVTAPLHQYHPEIASPADQSPSDQSCVELAAAGVPQLSFVNLAVASSMCNALLRLIMPVDGERMYDEVALDILDAVTVPHWISSRKEVASCLAKSGQKSYD